MADLVFGIIIGMLLGLVLISPIALEPSTIKKMQTVCDDNKGLQNAEVTNTIVVTCNNGAVFRWKQ